MATCKSVNFNALLAAFCLASLLFLMPNAAASNVTISIKQLKLGEIYLNYPFVVQQYDIMNITVGFKNIGSVTFKERMIVDIVNWTLGKYASFQDGSFTLIPGDMKTFKIKYIPTITGYQWIYVNATYEKQIAEAWGSFYVQPYPTPTIPAAPSAAAGPGAAAGPVEAGMVSMALSYPSEVEVAKGQSYLIYMMVENTGTKYGNASLNNIMFFAKGLGIPFSVVPQAIYKLESGKSSFFMITLNVPRNIDIGTYRLDFTVMSDELRRNGSISIGVVELPIKEEVYRTIQNYRFIIARLEGELDHAEAEGVNVTVARQYLGLAKVNVDEAQRLYDIEDYEKALDILKTAKKNIEMCVLELALAREKLYRLFLPATPFAIIVIVLLVIITLLFFIFARRRRKEKERELEEEKAK